MGAGRVDTGGGVGAASGTGACAVLTAGLGVPALAGAWGLVRWKAEVVWLRGVLEATWESKGHPQPLGAGGKQGAGPPALQTFWIGGPIAQSRIRGGGGIHAGAPSPPLLRVVCHSARRQLAAEKLVWEGGACFGVERLSTLGSPRPWLPRDLFALRAERQQRASVMATECRMERPRGPCEVWANPWF